MQLTQCTEDLMLFKRITISCIRNLHHIDLQKLEKFNLIIGANGSGKTSILEAIHILATGKSFRTAQLKQYIQYGQHSALIFAQSSIDHSYGVEKKINGQSIIKVNSVLVASVSEIAKNLPIQIIEPTTNMLLDEGSKSRRQLIDWLLFHVEPKFYKTWLEYQRILANRNSLLKRKEHDGALYQPWEVLLCDLSLLLHNMRQTVIEKWEFFFNSVANALLPSTTYTLYYTPGFDTQAASNYTLYNSREQDIERGYTWAGAHRADFRVRTPAVNAVKSDELAHCLNAETVLSRGQKKMLLLALKLSQVSMLSNMNMPAVVLLDDMASELDAASLDKLLVVMAETNCQYFITLLEEDIIKKLSVVTHSIEMFHVEHGVIC